ncbi:unnamed protein product [Effrenium voratum]|uniref:WWE domain-containing protein n=1 Tax=Effrenium voratum TaxID=2562239 RepID=A0AA36J4L6_9DINO|nr:unnamed protein product [Effrenium voratum]
MGCSQGSEVAAPQPAAAPTSSGAVAGSASSQGPSSHVPRKPPPPERDLNNIEVPEGFIHPRDLPRFEPFAEEQPDWEWEKEEGQWRSYPLQESIELDRYWKVFQKDQDAASKAKLSLLKNSVVVDFVEMTAQAGDRQPRKIRRKLTQSDWLSNRFFFDAFSETLQKAGITVETEPEQMFDFRFVQDFRQTKDDGRKMFRGGKEYHLPVGWKRFAVQVKGVYDDGDNGWLREDESGWAVAYHGTSKEGLGGILCTGFRVGDRQKFAKEAGAGVYCTPTIQVAQHYSKPTLLRGHSVQIVLQLRVRPSAINPITDPKAHEFERKYWVINNPDDIRAYGVLIRELPLRDYILPEVMVYGRSHPGIRHLAANLVARQLK